MGKNSKRFRKSKIEKPIGEQRILDFPELFMISSGSIRDSLTRMNEYINHGSKDKILISL